MRYNGDEAAVAFSNAYRSGNCKVAYDGVGLLQLDALFVEYNIVEHVVLTIYGVGRVVGAPPHLIPNRGSQCLPFPR